jgi:hypothetical protein
MLKRVQANRRKCRMQRTFKALVDEYRDLDPSQTAVVPLQNKLPGKQDMCVPLAFPWRPKPLSRAGAELPHSYQGHIDCHII